MSGSSTTHHSSDANAAEMPADVEKRGSGGGSSSSNGKSAQRGAAGPQFVGFWSPEVAKLRKDYLVGMIRVTFLVSLVVWAFFSIYWGSLYKEYFYTKNLNAWLVNRDPNGVVGQNVTRAIQAISDSDQLGTISWTVVDPAQYTNADLDYEVGVEQRPWAVLIVREDATAVLEQARAAGDASYDPTSLLTLVYSESRNQQAVPGIVVAGTQSALNPTLARMSATLAAQYLSQNTANTAALQALVTAPQTISGSVAMGTRNLRPYLANPYNGAVLAATYVGLIYLVILAFNLVMAGFTFRQGIQRRLKLGSLIGMRILVPVALYLWLSLMFSLLQVAFKLDFNGWGLGYGAGFMTFWMVSWSAMCALGLMLECLISLLTPSFIAFALVFVIIANVSGALIPVEMTPSFYKYSYAFIFYNTKAVFLTIFTNAGKPIEILKHVGIIWAWVAVMLLTFPIWIWRERRMALKQMAASANQGASHGGHQQQDEHHAGGGGGGEDSKESAVDGPTHHHHSNGSSTTTPGGGTTAAPSLHQR